MAMRRTALATHTVTRSGTRVIALPPLPNQRRRRGLRVNDNLTLSISKHLLHWHFWPMYRLQHFWRGEASKSPHPKPEQKL